MGRALRVWLVGALARGVLLVLVLWAAGISLAEAQAAYQAVPPPPAFQAFDQNNIDLITMQGSIVGANASIGGAGSGLALHHTGGTALYHTGTGPVSMAGQFPYDPYTGALYAYCATTVASYCDNYPYPPGSIPGQMLVNFGGRSEWFNLPIVAGAASINGVYTPGSNAKGSLSCSSGTCTYVAYDGTVATFKTGIGGEAQIALNAGSVQTVVKPDGEVLTYTYAPPGNGFPNTQRYTVSSSLGWALKGSPSQFVGGNYQLINSGIAYCDPAAYNCTSLTQFPVFTDNQDPDGNSFQLNVTIT